MPKPARPVRSRTEIEYDATRKYIQHWQENPAGTFADFLLKQKIAQSTRCKHLRQALTLQRRGAKITGELGKLKPALATPPPQFSDDDFQTLYDAFHEIDFPKFVQ